MVRIIADNILSPLGKTTRENLQAVRDYRTCLQEHRLWEMPTPFMASLFDDEEGKRPTYEDLVVESILRCLDGQELSGRVLLVLSSTKGQTTGLQGRSFGESASRIEERILPFIPQASSLTSFTVSNACISGLSAQIVAQRLLEMEAYDYAIVSGCDVQTRFIVSGFQSFMALSPSECRPFDEDRNGLNLGEAAATLLFKRCAPEEIDAGDWIALSGYMRNDAFHISGPSRTAEGSYRALSAAQREMPNPICISAHGTATLYNDDMESKAINRAGMSEVPVSALKGYYGHTMGAAGILEAIVTMHALQEGWIPGTRGFETLGTSRPISVIGRHRKFEAEGKNSSFIKLMSGFGGCNAAMGFEFIRDIKGCEGILRDGKGRMCWETGNCLKPTLLVRITPEGVMLCGDALPVDGATGKALLTALYRQYVGDYPKFYKMDILSKLGFIATELLLKKEDSKEVFDESRAILLFGKTASQVADRCFEETIRPENYFPSPADFVYTLPNIVTGEIAIRNGLHGETCYFALSEHDERLMQQLVAQAFMDPVTTSVLCGWINTDDEEHFEADLALVTKQ